MLQGSTVNMNIMSRLYDSIKASSPNKEGYVYLGGALLVGTLHCSTQLVSTLVYILLYNNNIHLCMCCSEWLLCFVAPQCICTGVFSQAKTAHFEA